MFREISRANLNPTIWKSKYYRILYPQYVDWMTDAIISRELTNDLCRLYVLGIENVTTIIAN